MLLVLSAPSGQISLLLTLRPQLRPYDGYAELQLD